MQKKLKNLSKDSIVLVISNPRKHRDVNFNILKYMTENKQRGVYVSLNLHCDKVKKLLEDYLIDPKNIHLVCCKNGCSIDKRSSCSFISSPEQLTTLSTYLSKLIESGDFRFVLFDSITTLLMYNERSTTLKFLNFLSTRISSSGVKSVFTTLQDKKSEEVIEEFSQFCDEVMDLRKGTGAASKF